MMRVDINILFGERELVKNVFRTKQRADPGFFNRRGLKH
jgi:hypothetical protein